ncbi:DUF6325 family protein [Gordonia hankookensis]|uniref:DUF1269 domain-containing protein n=1 Tax=Gordonia hankookensis TaxID=589403 RepID=A0ABR7WDX2_9ACTN|nr:DUF6325 family protein [Gordonia hankookensis]MBD1320761.1 DUF1269 domain-containing protein [Gordonia hankookensis]
MADRAELGPIDYIVVELPDDTTTLIDQMIAEFAGIMATGSMRILDLVAISVDATGTVDVTEVEGVEDPRSADFVTSLAEILALEDVENIATAVTPGRSAIVIVWEYLCARPLVTLAQRSGSQIIAQGRIPTGAVVAALATEPPG